MTRSVAIEGLPGAGKTTLLNSLQREHPDVTFFNELVLPLPHSPARDFFVENDRVKAARCASHDRVVMERFWASTVAYVIAEGRMAGDPTTLGQAIRSLYGDRLPDPTACVFLDSDRAVQVANATDGLFPNPAFRRLLRSAYFEIFDSLAIPTLVVRRDQADVSAFVTRHLLAV